MSTIILGINAYHGDSAACLIKDGKIIAACEEERLNRVKHYAGFPSLAIQTCLKQTNLKLKDINYIGISKDPKVHLLNKIFYSLTHGWQFSKLINSRLRNASHMKNICQTMEQTLSEKLSPQTKVHYVEHHLAHLGSAFFVSPFNEAAILSVDGFGDFVSTKSAYGRNNSITTLNEIGFPHSLGIFYTAMTQFLGFPNYGDEYKVMALAAYGEPRFESSFKKIIKLDFKKGFHLNLDYFTHHSKGIEMNWENGYPTLSSCYSQKMIEEFGPSRLAHEAITQHHKDLASSVQKTFETAYFHLINLLYRKTYSQNLCLAGGCAFNSVANGKIREFSPFQNIFIQPAAGDAGTALGAAFYIQHQILSQARQYEMKQTYLGPEYSSEEIETAVQSFGFNFTKLDDPELIKQTAQALKDGKIIGWFQGKMEFGPRALGNRSLLADPRRNEAREWLNQKIKLREDFRPFAPSVMKEEVDEYFEDAQSDFFMTRVFKIKKDKQKLIPAVTHVDGTGRLQVVEQESNPKFWSLLNEFKKLTGIGILLNTSFNENEPIVCSPKEALDCFRRTQFDYLVIGNFFIEREKNHAEQQEELCHSGVTKK